VLAEQLKASGIVRFVREYRWHPTRRFRGDIVFTLPGDKLIVEIEGAVHRIRGRFHGTIERNQQAVLQGWRILPVSTRQVRDGSACRLIQKVLG
jgi:very-short-patch-repair endonuclease